MAKEKYRSRTHLILLYPDCKEHIEALEKIKQKYDYAMILHDKDTTEEGELKKEHWHIVIRFKDGVWSTAICKELGIEHNYIEEVKRFDNALKYLIHYNDKDKYQYSLEEVSGSIKTRLTEIVKKEEKSEAEKVIEIIEYIESQNKRITIKAFANYCASQGYWSEFRRSASIFIRMIDEHNNNL